MALFAILALGLAYHLCLVGEGIGLIDEGHLANAARRLAAGEVLYRDVYTVYPPRASSSPRGSSGSSGRASP